MINQDKWINSLPNISKKHNIENAQVDHDRWVNTISKQKTYNVVKKYSVMLTVFVCSLLFVSAIKNETRNLEKDINNLKASNNAVQFNLDQAILDHEVITSPENISLLAKEYLNINFSSYTKSQIVNLNENKQEISKINLKKDKISKVIKVKVAKQIEKKKIEIQKLQQLYQKPEEIPAEIKNQIAQKIKFKKKELKNLYSSPKETITFERVQKWVAAQVVKVFLGMPIIPGR